uniref:Uncharacterized protein n=1 Tax=Rhizophora mucronata TaxID=61149 RepID=A0A2P2KC13_RHIMU
MGVMPVTCCLHNCLISSICCVSKNVQIHSCILISDIKTFRPMSEHSFPCSCTLLSSSCCCILQS